MTCTRRKESTSALVLGARGLELRWKYGHRRTSIVLPASLPPLERDESGGIVVPIFADTRGSEAEAEITMSLLSDSPTPTEVYA